MIDTNDNKNNNNKTPRAYFKKKSPSVQPPPSNCLRVSLRPSMPCSTPAFLAPWPAAPACRSRRLNSKRCVLASEAAQAGQMQPRTWHRYVRGFKRQWVSCFQFLSSFCQTRLTPVLGRQKQSLSLPNVMRK